ncbi:retrovirus-related pol polyprotein from transposon TNT 1-94 [Tanacetum coccineum]
MFVTNLQPEWSRFTISIRHNQNLTKIDINVMFNLLKHNQEEVDDIKEEIKKRDKKEMHSQIHTYDPLAFQGGIRLERDAMGKEVAIRDATCYNYGKQGHYSRNCPSGKVRDKSYLRTKMLLAAKEENGQALTAY